MLKAVNERDPLFSLSEQKRIRSDQMAILESVKV
jgi:hypothetical protein